METNCFRFPPQRDGFNRKLTKKQQCFAYVKELMGNLQGSQKVFSDR